MKSIFTIILLLIIAIFTHAQDAYFSSPLKIPLLLSGSFAELRSNHFHSGIDIKTQGVTGLPVYAAADGYIARVAVSPTGYGNALYVNHPNGTTTVYGHLSKFSPDLAKYVKDKQYEEKSFRVNLIIPSGLFPVKQNEEIAKSGNSGSSGGPHLHFEIRDTQSEDPMNPMNYNFPITDNIAPKIFSVLFVPLNDSSHVNYKTTAQSFQVVFYDGKYHIKSNPKIPVWGEIGIAIKANDYLNGTHNKCGINKLSMSVDNEEQFAFRLDRFAFKDTRYINSHIVYGKYISQKRRYIKTWLQPGNKLTVYDSNETRGIITPVQDKTQNINIEVADSHGNNSALIFSISGKKKAIHRIIKESTPFAYNKSNTFENGKISIEIPEGALYDNLDFEYHSEPSPENFYSDFFFVHKKYVPLHKNITIDIKPDSLPQKLQTKAIIVNANPETGKYYSAGGNYKDGQVETTTKYFGVFAVTVDTIPPKIIPLSIKNNAITETSRIRFKISDDLSGINTYEGLIDGKWALFEYDAKKHVITHYFDKSRFEMGKRHNFKLTVTDSKNNSTGYECTFWK